MTVPLTVPTKTLFHLVFDRGDSYLAWAAETNCSPPKLPLTMNLSSDSIEIIFPDEASAIAFKLRWL